MIFIIGGAYQGKKNFAAECFDLIESEIVDGSDSMGKIMSAKCINKYEDFVFQVLENNGDPGEITLKLLQNNNQVIIIMTEIGSGIIPIDKAERIRREYAGKIGCLLAEKADSVIRLVCGIPMVLK